MDVIAELVCTASAELVPASGLFCVAVNIAGDDLLPASPIFGRPLSEHLPYRETENEVFESKSSRSDERRRMSSEPACPRSSNRAPSHSR